MTTIEIELPEPWRSLILALFRRPGALVDVPEAAEILGITEEALRSRVKRGQIPKTWLLRTGKSRAGEKGGNSGRVQFWRARLIEAKV